MTAPLDPTRENKGQVILEYALLLAAFLLLAAPGVHRFSSAIGDSFSAASLHATFSSSPGKMTAQETVQTSGLNFHTTDSQVTRKTMTLLQHFATTLHIDQATLLR